jgi:hypothetical protein
MNVYIVISYGQEEECIEKIFLDKKKAEKYSTKLYNIIKKYPPIEKRTNRWYAKRRIPMYELIKMEEHKIEE